MYSEPRRVRATPAMRALLRKPVEAHKYTHGHALVLSGGPGRTGAARLSARAALRVGAGLVTLGVPPSAQMEVAMQITAIMLRRVADADGLAALLEDPRITALCMGPGMGVERSAALLPVALARGLRLVLDADALTALAGDEDLRAGLHAQCVLTPHEGEFARLAPDLANGLRDEPKSVPSRVKIVRVAAKYLGCTVLLKGPQTLVARPDGACSLHEAHAPWLATAGSGDVLAGFIAGLLARGLDTLSAAETATYLHAEAARSFGPGLIAEDIPDALPEVLDRMGV